MASEGVTTVGPRTGVVGDFAGTAFACLKSSKRHEGFVGGARGIGAPHGAIEKRFVNGFTEHFPTLAVNAIDK